MKSKNPSGGLHPRKPVPVVRTAIIVALVGLVGMICVVLIVSLLLAALFLPTRIVAPTPTLSPTRTMIPAPSATARPSLTPSVTSLPTNEVLDIKGVPMHLIPAGSFMMGSQEGDDDEKPVHHISLDAFYIDKYEVTNARYKACVNADGCTEPHLSKSYTRESYYGNPQFDDYPVIYVDWNQAKEYCEWRNARLPTEAEWEYAARGPSTSLGNRRIYPWGEKIDETHANYDLSGIGDTSIVGSYESGKSIFGIYDLAGNVWEWVNDWYDESYYANSPTSNPQGPTTGKSRVLRGGAWNNNGNILRSADRTRLAPVNGYNYIGFRCAFAP